MGALANAIDDNTRALDAATAPELRQLLPALHDAQAEVAKLVERALDEADAGWEARRARSLLFQMHHAVERIKARLGQAAMSALNDGGAHATHVAMLNLNRMLDAGYAEHTAMRFDVARVLATAKRTVWSRFRTSAARYGGDVGDDIRRRLMTGVLRGEGVDQLTSRLLASTGMIRALRGDGEAISKAVADQTFSRARSKAERLVRTELVNAYGETQAEGIRAADEEDPGMLKRWDAALDGRTCEYCRELDRKTVAPDAMFYSTIGTVDHPPLHPWCRCACIPWRRGWTL